MNYTENAGADFLTKYAQQVASDLLRTNFDVLARIAGLILETKRTGKRIYTAGNGGSAATASRPRRFGPNSRQMTKSIAATIMNDAAAFPIAV